MEARDDLRRLGTHTLAEALQDLVGIDSGEGSDSGARLPNVGMWGLREFDALLELVPRDLPNDDSQFYLAAPHRFIPGIAYRHFQLHPSKWGGRPGDVPTERAPGGPGVIVPR